MHIFMGVDELNPVTQEETESFSGVHSIVTIESNINRDDGLSIS